MIETLYRALGKRQVKVERLLIDTDQVSQYRATDHRELLKKHQISCSMPAKAAAGITPWWRASSSHSRWNLF